MEAAIEAEMEPEIILSSPAPARMIEGPVARFVDVQCEVDDSNLVLAKDLYTGFQEWCRDTGQNDVSQRSFGMQLTAMGFQRRRRGRGKHWWDGIKLGAPIQPVEALAEEVLVGAANGHHESYQTELLA